MMKSMMELYYNKFDHIRGTMICKPVGIHLNNLDLKGACLNHILGRCGIPNCDRRHPEASTALREQVKFICDKLKPGIDRLVNGVRNEVGTKE